MPQASSIRTEVAGQRGIVEHRVVQRRQDALERVLLAHVPQHTLVMRLKSSKKSSIAFPQVPTSAR